MTERQGGRETGRDRETHTETHRETERERQRGRTIKRGRAKKPPQPGSLPLNVSQVRHGPLNTCFISFLYSLLPFQFDPLPPQRWPLLGSDGFELKRMRVISGTSAQCGKTKKGRQVPTTKWSKHRETGESSTGEGLT